MENLTRILDNIKNQISTLQDDSNKEILNNFYEAINLISDKIEEVTVKQETIEENIQFIDDDLTSLQEEVFEELSFEELEDIEDEYVEINCKHCNKPLFVEKDVYDGKKEIPCPFCNEIIKY